MRLANGQIEQGQDEREEATPPADEPSRAWGTMFAAQCTGDMLRRVRRYAHRIASSVAEVGGIGGEACAEELLQDCIADTLSGVLVWDPAVVTLESYLMSRIRSRGRDERHRVLKLPHASIDVSPDEDDAGPSVLDEAEQALILGQDEAAERRARTFECRASACLTQVRDQADRDPDLRAVLDAVDRGAEGKSEILAASGLSDKAYRNARLRLRRLGDRLLADPPQEDPPDEANE